MLLEISNKKENYLNYLGLLKASKLSVKNSIRLIKNNDRFQFNVIGIDDDVEQNGGRRLKNQSSKTNRITIGKNRQEEKLLTFRKKQIDRSCEIEDNKWINELIGLGEFLEDIKMSTSGRSTSIRSSMMSTKQINLNRNLYNLVRNIRSYTSIIGEENDKNREELKAKLYYRPSVVTFFDDVDDDSGGFKSVRRPLRRTSSVWHLQFKRKSLQNKLDLFNEQKEKMMVGNKHDRNVRYGDPLPRSEIYRHMRLVSKLEDSI